MIEPLWPYGNNNSEFRAEFFHKYQFPGTDPFSDHYPVSPAGSSLKVKSLASLMLWRCATARPRHPVMSCLSQSSYLAPSFRERNRILQRLCRAVGEVNGHKNPPEPKRRMRGCRQRCSIARACFQNHFVRLFDGFCIHDRSELSVKVGFSQTHAKGLSWLSFSYFRLHYFLIKHEMRQHQHHSQHA